MEACSFLLVRRDGTSGEVCADKLFPAGELFVAPIQPKVHGKTHRATDIMTRDGIVCEGIGGVAMVIMAVHIVEQTADMLAQGVIKDQGSGSLRTAYCLSLLEQIGEPTVIDAVLEPRRFREEAGQVGFVSALQHTAGDVSQTFVVQDNQTSQVMLEMAKLAPILKEIAKDIRVGSHEGCRSYDGKLHKTFALSPKGRGRA